MTGLVPGSIELNNLTLVRDHWVTNIDVVVVVVVVVVVGFDVDVNVDMVATVD